MQVGYGADGRDAHSTQSVSGTRIDETSNNDGAASPNPCSKPGASRAGAETRRSKKVK